MHYIYIYIYTYTYMYTFNLIEDLWTSNFLMDVGVSRTKVDARTYLHKLPAYTCNTPSPCGQPPIVSSSYLLTHGIHMEYTWNTHGIHMEYTWNTHGIHILLLLLPGSPGLAWDQAVSSAREDVFIYIYIYGNIP